MLTALRTAKTLLYESYMSNVSMREKNVMHRKRRCRSNKSTPYYDMCGDYPLSYRVAHSSKICPAPPPCIKGDCSGSIRQEFELSHSRPFCPISVDYCAYPRTGCPDFGSYIYNWEDQCCCNKPYTPIVIDVAGDGFRLTDNLNGVNFNLY